MSENKKPCNIKNFKELYNKRYGDIARISTQASLTPEQVFDLAVRYFTWAEGNHIQAGETATFQGRVYEDCIHKPRVFTLTGFRLFAGISESVLTKWRKEPGFRDVMEFIDGVIHEQKFQLAANNMINASLIAKDLGIDKQATVNVEATATSTSIDAVTAAEVTEAVKSILEEI